jgi:hypothetical protein
MEVILTVAVRNPEWYWSKEELEEVGDYRKEWEAINEGKISKHVPSEEFEIPFDVTEIKENRKGEFQLILISEDRTNSISHYLTDVTIVQFLGEKDQKKIEVVISNSLIHQYIGVRQKHYKYYVYFYLKANIPYEKLHQLIWISDAHRKELEELIGIQNQE